MNPEMERTMRNLGVLASLKQNDKLMTSSDIFCIYEPTVMRSLWRLVTGESRELNVQRVQTTLRSAMVTISDTESMEMSDRNHQVKALKSAGTRMRTLLRKALQGIGNMTITYRDDAALCSMVSILSNEVEDFLQSNVLCVGSGSFHIDDAVEN
jgi:hypothetical protein